MKIAIIDADLVGNKKHRFPNLVCMKISGYHKELGNDVELKLDYDNLRTRNMNSIDGAENVEKKSPYEHFSEFYEKQNNQKNISYLYNG